MPFSGHLAGVIKQYDWGGITGIPRLLNIDNRDKKPYAEYWLGTHPQAACYLVDNEKNISLATLIADDPESVLGSSVAGRFNGLPYLLKLLDVSDMLSIQVHPGRKAAIKGFEKENAKGIPLDAPARSYRDINHKPELMVALGEFWLLHGFRKDEELKLLFRNIPELTPFIPVLDGGGRTALFSFAMEMPQSLANSILFPLIERLKPLFLENKLSKNHPSYWVAKASEKYASPNADRGLFCIYFFNLVQLKKGEAIFQPAGVPHAYLEGMNVEIMANSDNVLRGGLTNKHIDIEELIRNTDCNYDRVGRIEPQPMDGFQVFSPPVEEFILSYANLNVGSTIGFRTRSVEILMITEGRCNISTGNNKIILEPGHPSFVATAGQDILIHAELPTVIFRASVPEMMSTIVNN